MFFLKFKVKSKRMGWFKKMMGFLIFLTVPFFVSAQGSVISSQEEVQKPIVQGFSYPDFQDGSRYASFDIRYPVNETTEIGLFGYHYKNLIAERFRIPIQIKQYVSKKKIYIISGYEQEWDMRNQSKGKINGKPIQSVFSGMGYDVKPGFSVEAMFQSVISSSDFDPLGLDDASTMLKISTKYKF